jgi:hypothetical protein
MRAQTHLVGEPAAVCVPRVAYDPLQKPLQDETASLRHARVRFPYETRVGTGLVTRLNDGWIGRKDVRVTFEIRLSIVNSLPFLVAILLQSRGAFFDS